MPSTELKNIEKLWPSVAGVLSVPHNRKDYANLCNRLDELVDVVERAVYRCEPDVCHGIDLVQLPERSLSDCLGGNFPLRPSHEDDLILDILQDLLDRLLPDVTFFGGDPDSPFHFLDIERFPPAVTLHDHQRFLLDSLV